MVKWKRPCLLSLAFVIPIERGTAQGNCTDFKKQIVVQGQRFIPLGYDPCTTCTCENGEAAMCNSVLCSPPKDCLNSQLADDKCCEFMCKNGDIDHNPVFNVTNVETKEIETVNNTNLGLRLVASTVTSFLILALLLFMIHRLRQRRLLLMIRRFNNLNPGPCSNRRYPMRENGSVGYYPHHNHITFGYFEDPPPPYSFWKPESYIAQEAPPPYEIALNSSHIISPICSPHLLSSGMDLHYQLPIPSLSNVSLHANNFQINDLDRERSGNNQSAALPLHSLNVTGSMSSLHENNLNVDADEDAMAIRSDATYEECSLYKNKTNCNRNFLLNALPGSETDENAIMNEMSQASGSNKCHSCSDVVNCWQRNKQEVGMSDHMKRHSLQSPLSKKCNNATRCFPDPTSWIGDVSESSCSSSPTYEQRTLSPTSSDSGSIDYNLPCDNDHSRLLSSFRQKPLKCQLCSPVGAPSPHDLKDKNEAENARRDGVLLKNVQRNSQAENKSSEADIGCNSRSVSRLPKETDSEKPINGSEFRKSNLVSGSGDGNSGSNFAKPVSKVTRITYVSDGEDQNTNTSRYAKRENLPPSKARPKSYDFGNLCVNKACSEGNSVNASSCACEGKRSSSQLDYCCDLSSGLKDTSCSFDSLTCSSQASFGSTSSSSGRDDHAGPSTSGPPDGFVATAGASHSDNGYVQSGRLYDHPGSAHSSAFSVSASGSSDLSHSRSASVCSETGERKHQGLSGLPRDHEHPNDPVRVQTPRTPQNFHQIRLNGRTYNKQNQESYI